MAVVAAGVMPAGHCVTPYSAPTAAQPANSRWARGLFRWDTAGRSCDRRAALVLAGPSAAGGLLPPRPDAPGACSPCCATACSDRSIPCEACAAWGASKNFCAAHAHRACWILFTRVLSTLADDCGVMVCAFPFFLIQSFARQLISDLLQRLGSPPHMAARCWGRCCFAPYA